MFRTFCIALAAALSALPSNAQGSGDRRPGVIEKSARQQQGRRVGSLRLPRVRSPQETRAGEEERFETFEMAVGALRRSLFLAPAKEEQLLYQLGDRFKREDIAERTLVFARRADPDRLYACMRVLELYGSPEHGDRIKYLLLTRRFRKATDAGVDVMVKLMGASADDALFELLRSERASVRARASEHLTKRVGPALVGRVLNLAQQGSKDTSLEAIRLLGSCGSDEVDPHLIGWLSANPAFAMAAVGALQARGESAADDLRAVLEQPARDRSFAYAALALACIDEQRFAGGRDDTTLFTEAMRPHLLAELASPEDFGRACAALGLAQLAWESAHYDESRYHDRDVVSALVDIIAPRGFVLHLSDLEHVVRPRIVRLSGRDFGMSGTGWLSWHDAISGVEGWIGARSDVQVTERDASQVVVEIPMTAEAVGDDGREGESAPVWRFIGDRVDRLADRTDAVDVVLGPTDMMLLVEDMRSRGFPRAVPRADVRLQRSNPVTLSLHGARCSTPPDMVESVRGRFLEIAANLGDRNVWQLYRDPRAAPDLLAWWRAETRWRSAHTDPADRANRLVGMIVRRLAQGLDASRVELALGHLALIDDVERYLDTERGQLLVQFCADQDEWSSTLDRVAAIALRVPGDEVWRSLLTVAQEHAGEVEDSDLMIRIFGLLGEERLRAAFQHPNRTIQLLAMQEVADAGDAGSIPGLIEMAGSDDLALKCCAIESLGLLRAQEAEPVLVEFGASETLPPAVRRAAWIALARVGSPQAMELIEAAMRSTDEGDRMAVVEALGNLRTPSAVEALTRIYGFRGEDQVGLLAKDYLRAAGDLLATPPLRELLVRSEAGKRRNIALLLAEFQDRAALEDLVQMLDGPGAYRAVTMIATITGYDAVDRPDRRELIRSWLQRHGRRSQADWLFVALAAYNVQHTLDIDRVVPGNTSPANVRELARLVVDANPPFLRCLAGKILRESTQQDLGTIVLSMNEEERRAVASRYTVLVDDGAPAAARADSGKD